MAVRRKNLTTSWLDVTSQQTKKRNSRSFLPTKTAKNLQKSLRNYHRNLRVRRRYCLLRNSRQLALPMMEEAEALMRATEAPMRSANPFVPIRGPRLRLRVAYPNLLSLDFRY